MRIQKGGVAIRGADVRGATAALWGGVAGAMAVAAISAAPAVAATTSASVSAIAGTNLGSPSHLDNHSISNPTQSVLTASSSSAGAGDAASASAYAFAAPGHLAVSSASTASVTAVLVDSLGNLSSRLDGGSGQSEATAVWSDNLHVSALNYHGGGYITARLLLNGSNSATTILASTINMSGPNGSSAYFQNSASAALTVIATGISASSFDAACSTVGLGSRIACARLDTNYPGSPTANYGLGSVHNLDLRIQLDTRGSASVTYELVADSTAAAYGSYYRQSGSAGGSGIVDVAHTLLWGGVTGLYDSSGNPISGATITSDSGFNYLNSAAPEPGVWAMMMASIAGIGMTLRRRKAALRS